MYHELIQIVLWMFFHGHASKASIISKASITDHSHLLYYVFHVSCAAWHVVHRRSINICGINELAFLKGQNYKRDPSFFKVYNLESSNC